jgi:hypothetical protein
MMRFSRAFGRGVMGASTRLSRFLVFLTHDNETANVLCRSSESRKEIGFGGGYWESKARGQTTLGWTANDVFSYVNQRLNLLHNSPSSGSILPASGAGTGTEVGKRLIAAPKQPLASKWGLDKLFRWKLSREFAEAYPFLDCTGGKLNLSYTSTVIITDLGTF